MAGLTIDGAVSGLQTSSIIDQLMTAEAGPQNALKTKVTDAQSASSAYQFLNTRFASLLSAAEALTKNDTWGAAKATSSVSSVTASAVSGAPSGTFAFHVDSTATAHAVVSQPFEGLKSDTDNVIAPSNPPGDPKAITFQKADGTIATVMVTQTSLRDVVDSINRSSAGVRAAAVRDSNGFYRLQLTAAGTGEKSAFTVSGLDVPGFDTTTQARDAKITIGSGAGAYSVSSSTNTFSGVMPSVTFTVSTANVDASIDVTTDGAAIADKVAFLVDAINGTSGEISRQTAYDAQNKKASPLTGDYAVRELGQRLLSQLSAGVAVSVGGKTVTASLKDIGIETDRTGTVTFNRDAFLAAFKADPAKTKSYFTDGTTAASGTPSAAGRGLADRLWTVSDEASNKTVGTLTLAVRSKDAAIKDLTTRISDWDSRLQARRATLQAQFTAMEVALSKLKDQSSWISAQLAPTTGSNS